MLSNLCPQNLLTFHSCSYREGPTLLFQKKLEEEGEKWPNCLVSPHEKSLHKVHPQEKKNAITALVIPTSLLLQIERSWPRIRTELNCLIFQLILSCLSSLGASITYHKTCSVTPKMLTQTKRARFAYICLVTNSILVAPLHCILFFFWYLSPTNSTASYTVSSLICTHARIKGTVEETRRTVTAH